MRGVVALFGVIMGLAGIIEIVAPAWAIVLAHEFYHIVPIMIGGAVASAIGAVLLVAAAKRLVGLRTYVIVLGGIMVAFGLVCIIEPGLIRDLGYAVLFRRSWAFQLILLWVSGTLRFVLGGALVYAAMLPPRVRSSAQ